MKKIIASLAVFLVAAVVVVGAVGMTRRMSWPVRPVTAEAPCPVVGCASGRATGSTMCPSRGVTEMTCPEAGCVSVECHAWEALTAATIRRATPA